MSGTELEYWKAAQGPNLSGSQAFTRESSDQLAVQRMVYNPRDLKRVQGLDKSWTADSKLVSYRRYGARKGWRWTGAPRLAIY
ncbi:MAG: hypothetical protein SH818_06605 [Saprospiraceae bacterium]|nr:hypothetical protein [Saprospiraceae bacterium]